MKTPAPLLAFSAVLLAGAAQAAGPSGQSPYYMDGDQLLAYCSQDDELSRGACSGYVAGAIDMISAMNLARRRVLVCVPPEMELRKLADIVVARLRDQPDVRRYAATGQIIVALGEAFPCDADQQGAGLSRPEQQEQLEQPEQAPADQPQPEPPRSEPADQPDEATPTFRLVLPEHADWPSEGAEQRDAPQPEPSRPEDQPEQSSPERPRPYRLRPDEPWPDQPWPDQPRPDRSW